MGRFKNPAWSKGAKRSFFAGVSPLLTHCVCPNGRRSIAYPASLPSCAPPRGQEERGQARTSGPWPTAGEGRPSPRALANWPLQLVRLDSFLERAWRGRGCCPRELGLGGHLEALSNQVGTLKGSQTGAQGGSNEEREATIAVGFIIRRNVLSTDKAGTHRETHSSSQPWVCPLGPPRLCSHSMQPQSSQKTLKSNGRCKTHTTVIHGCV